MSRQIKSITAQSPRRHGYVNGNTSIKFNTTITIPLGESPIPLNGPPNQTAVSINWDYQINTINIAQFNGSGHQQ
jgi:hypothetical protein